MIDSHPSDLFQPGDLLNNTYRIELLLGRGGTSDVYKARSEISGNLVAIKVLKQELAGNEDFTVLMAREENIREIRHDAVVRYSENHRTPDGHIYLLMDYVEGPGLDKKLKQGPMSAEDLLIICRRVTEGLKAAHTRNIVHRDLSPDNIILRNGEPSQAVIIDFGIAKDTNPGAETIVGNEFAGKYSYAAPEQMAGLTDARSDIYSLGALLLANFRGKSPSLGNNPMEVVENKKLPLDTDGLPPPFKQLIERMCDPDPDSRFQSAAEVLAFLDNPKSDAPSVDVSDAPDNPPTEDATIIVPRNTSASTTSTASSSQSQTTDKPQSKSGVILAGLLLTVVIALGFGGYVSGVFDRFLAPQYPVAAPFTLIIDHPEKAPSRAVGNMPSKDSRTALASWVDQAELTLASGEIADSWAEDVLATIQALEDLAEWRLAISNNQARLTGRTDDAELAASLSSRFSKGLPGSLEGAAEIAFVLPALPLADVRAQVSAFENCGPLRVHPAQSVAGFGPEEPITITGRIAGPETRIEIYDSLQKTVGERKLTIDTEVLNPALCAVEQFLPKAPSGDIAIDFTVGAENRPNPSGRFFVGENPVIDVVLPAETTAGYLTVSILDVSGNVFHLLPNIMRQNNNVAELRAGQSGPFPLRVAYDLATAAQTGGIAFKVDDSTLGKSRVLVLHSAEPLFDGLRPTSESAVGFAEALKENASRDSGLILSLDSRILTTALKP